MLFTYGNTQHTLYIGHIHLSKLDIDIVVFNFGLLCPLGGLVFRKDFQKLALDILIKYLAYKTNILK